MLQHQTYIDVILPLAVQNTYTYSIPPHLIEQPIEAGMRVVVQFGNGNKLYAAIIKKIHFNKPEKYTPKDIDSILDATPLVNQHQFLFWEWLQEYYLCTPGEIMNAALPAAFRIASETKVLKNPQFSYSATDVSDHEFLILEALEIQPVLSILDISKILNFKNVLPFIKKLVENGAILLEEEIKEKYKPRKEKYIKLTENTDNEKALQQIFAELEKKAFKQLELLMCFIKLNNRYGNEKKEVRKNVLLKTANSSAGVLEQLFKKNILTEYDKEVGRIPENIELSNKIKELSEAQEKALQEIKNNFLKKDIVLLHGITSSGKTEIYVHLIQEQIKLGKQILYLLPEIALTTQLITRLKKYFGNKVGVYHSRFNENERVEIWNEVLSKNKNRFQIIIGARSALFLPYSNLGLVIIDEEHESSFKQFDPAPRYHARDAAMVLANQHKAKVVLGSATPSIESYYNALSNKYALVELKERFGGVLLPQIIFCDISEEHRKKKMHSHFSNVLLEEITKALENGEQVILFQNRRGYAPFLMCQTCGHVPECKNCDVSLTYHKLKHKLVCHLCGYNENMSQKCPACGSINMSLKGFGTEKIEEEIGIFFPQVKIARLDLDSTRAKNAYHRIISDFEEKNIQILVGTQMVTKGLDFDNVGLVGVLNADNMLYFPDFRAYERSLQLMLQVAGRAGRKSKQGKVIIQTFNPKHKVIDFIQKHNYKAFYNYEIEQRKNYNYPPFFRIIKITLKHIKPEVLNLAAETLASQLKVDFGNRVLGPEFPTISRIHGLYQKNILLKTEKNIAVKYSREYLKKAIDNFQCSEYKSVRVTIDVDAY